MNTCLCLRSTLAHALSLLTLSFASAGALFCMCFSSSYRHSAFLSASDGSHPPPTPALPFCPLSLSPSLASHAFIASLSTSRLRLPTPPSRSLSSRPEPEVEGGPTPSLCGCCLVPAAAVDKEGLARSSTRPEASTQDWHPSSAASLPACRPPLTSHWLELHFAKCTVDATLR